MIQSNLSGFVILVHNYIGHLPREILQVIICCLYEPARRNLGAANKYLYELHNPQRRNIAFSATEVVGTDVFPA